MGINVSDGDRLKALNPSLYYAILEWKDKHHSLYREMFEIRPIHQLSRKELQKLAQLVVSDTFKTLGLNDQIELSLRSKAPNGELDL